MLNSVNIMEADVEMALKKVFTKVSVPYSMCQPSAIHSAEVQAIHGQCRLKVAVGASNPEFRKQQTKIVFSHPSREKSDIATEQVEEMIRHFEHAGIERSEIMYQYSMDINPGQHW